VVKTRVRDLPVIVPLLALLCGLRPSSVLLEAEPTSPDIIDAPVIITAHRGQINLGFPKGCGRRQKHA
jgi:hypothetical protein